MESKFEISPYNQKITEAAKKIVRLLCKEKPWKGANSTVYYKLPREYIAPREELRCVIDINYHYNLRIGLVEVSIGGGAPIVGLIRKGDDVYLELSPEGCDFTFTDGFPEFLDDFNAWDDIVSRKPPESIEDEA